MYPIWVWAQAPCQGQTVANEDLLIRIRSIAWLFDLSKHSDEADDKPCTDSGYDSQSESDEISEKESSIHLNKEATISYEELNTGIEITGSSDDNQPSSLTYPSAWPADPLEEQLIDVKKRQSSIELQHVGMRLWIRTMDGRDGTDTLKSRWVTSYTYIQLPDRGETDARHTPNGRPDDDV